MGYTNSKTYYNDLTLRRQVSASPCNASGDVTDHFNYNYTNTFNGDYNPRWRQQVKKAIGATTTASGVKRSLIYVPGYGQALWNQSKAQCPPNGGPIYRTYTGNLFNVGTWPADPAGISTTKADLVALSNYYKKLKQSQTTFQGGVFLAELREAVRMIKHPAMTLRKGIDDYLKTVKKQLRKNRNPKVRRNIPSNTWLEYQFGWAPLMNDIRDGNTALEHLKRVHPLMTKKVVGFGVDETVTFTNRSFSSGLVWSWQDKDVSTCKVFYSGAVKIEASGSLTMEARLLGIGLSDFVPTVWELIPYSFLIDYFTNIGDVLSSWAFPTASVAWNQRTIVRIRSREAVGVNSTTEGFYKRLAFIPGSKKATWRLFERAPLPDVPVLPLTFKVPGTTSLKWLNIAALVNPRIKGSYL